jgi:hypothetical protein
MTIMRVRSSIILITLILSSSYSNAHGAIDGPSSEDAPIRLSSKTKPITTPHEWKLHDPPEVTEKESQYRPLPDASTQLNNQAQKGIHADARLEIVEPPNKSYIAGKNFLVKLKVNLPQSAEESFKKAYEGDGHACLSLDEGPFHCWNFDNAKMFYTEATDGNHTLIAKLYKDGTLQDETSSEKISFTMVHNPEFIEGDLDLHSQNMINRESEKDETILEEEDGVEVTYPVVQIMNPLHRVSYSGTDIGIRTLLEPINPKLFEKFFQNGFSCFNVDFATAYACYPLFQDNAHPFVLGMNVGMHALEASLLNPETGNLLKDSSTGRHIFFMAGQSNKGAHFVADINIRGKLHKVPLVQGGSILAQAKSLCSSVGLTGNVDCIEPVLQHLTVVADQHGFVNQEN